MFPSEFEFLINLNGEKISKKDTAFRKAISVQERLALTFLVQAIIPGLKLGYFICRDASPGTLVG
jgi:hypothetical protein